MRQTPIARSACSWCHTTNPESELRCQTCGHDAHVARHDCSCDVCARVDRVTKLHIATLSAADELLARNLAESVERMQREKAERDEHERRRRSQALVDVETCTLEELEAATSIFDRLSLPQPPAV